jgi:hypothetical protein
LESINFCEEYTNNNNIDKGISYNGALVFKRRKEGKKHKGKSPFLLEEEAWVV